MYGVTITQVDDFFASVLGKPVHSWRVELCQEFLV